MARASRVDSGSSQQPRKNRAGGTWSREEDERLSKLVETYGERAWVKVAEGFNDVRDKKQCRERWCNHVNPNINGSPFSSEESIFILDFYIQNGRQWAKMSRSKELQGRPDNAIKNHFNTNLRPHYIELCKEHNLPMRQSDNIDPIELQTYSLIEGKVTAPPSIGIRGVKVSRFVRDFSCKIESLVNTSPKTINERRRRALTLQDICTNPSHLQVPEGPSSSRTLMQYDSVASKWKPASIVSKQQQTSQWTQAQSRSVSLYEDMDWSGSEYSKTSPSTQENRHSPYTCSERSLPRVEDPTLSIAPINPWYDASGYYSLPPLVRTATPPTPSALFSTFSLQSNVDEEHKALLHKRSNIGCRDDKEGDIISRSLLFSTL